MSDATHEIADDGFHEIHLSGKQLVFLFMATTVVSVVIFLCGVLVGRGVPTQQSQEQVTDPAFSAAPPVSSPMTDTGLEAAEPPAPPAESADLSYRRRLEGDGPPDSLKPAPVSQAPPAVAARPLPESRTATAAAEAAEPPPVRQPGQTTAKLPAGRPPSTAEAPAAAGAQPGTWVVQVHALRDRDVANGIVQRLASKGYPAFLVAAGPPAGIFRVQVGRFRERGDAERVLNRLKKEEQFDPWITR